MKKQPGFKYKKFIFCLMDAIIVLLITAYIFRLSQVNSQIESLNSLTPNQLYCGLCGKNFIEFQVEGCCQTSKSEGCQNRKEKKQCQEEQLSIKNKQAGEYTRNLTNLIILGCSFFILECCCEPCLGFLTKQLPKHFYTHEDGRLLKSGGISTLELQAGSSSSLSSFSSFHQNFESPNFGRSYLNQVDQMACPICLETLEHQKVIAFKCKHIVHSHCFKKKETTQCPICQ